MGKFFSGSERQKVDRRRRRRFNLTSTGEQMKLEQLGKRERERATFTCRNGQLNISIIRADGKGEGESENIYLD
jgi:hypothetical protein